MGFKSNFLTNVNLMAFCLSLPVLTSGILYILSRCSKSYKLKPRFLKQSKIFLYDMFFTLLLFNCFNIFVSTIINIQSFKMSLSASLIFSLFLCVLVPAVGLFYGFFRKYFLEFNDTLDLTTRVFSQSLKLSSKIKSMYPLCMLIEMTLIPLFLGPSALFSCGLYLSLAVTLLMTTYCFCVTPYVKNRDNIRLLVYRCSLNVMVILFCVLRSLETRTRTFGFILVAVLGILTLVAGIHFGYLLVRSYQYFRRPSCIDDKMLAEYRKKHGIEVDRVPRPSTRYDPTKSYPKLEYSRNTINHRNRLLSAIPNDSKK